MVTDDCDNEAEFTQTINVEISNVINAFDSATMYSRSLNLICLILLSGDFNMNGTWSVVLEMQKSMEVYLILHL